MSDVAFPDGRRVTHPPSSSRVRLWLGIGVGLLVAQTAVAEEPRFQTPGEADRALPGLLRVGLPTPALETPVAAASVGYGFLDDVEGSGNGQRFSGVLGAALPLTQRVSLGLDVRARIDSFSDAADGAESNSYGEPRLTLRAGFPAGAAFLGAELDARFVGAEAPSIDFAATSPSLRALLGAPLAPRTWLGAQVGVHIDRSAESVPNAELVSAPDRRTLGASSWNAVSLGFGASHRLSSSTELLGELSGDWLVGKDSPALGESPFRLGIGARHPLSSAWSILVNGELGLSARPEDLAADLLHPAEPRLSLGATLIWRIGNRAPPAKVEAKRAPPKPEEPIQPQEPEEPEVPTSPVKGSVVDEGGRPLPDVEVTLSQPGVEPKTTRTFADGSFVFEDLPEGALSLGVVTPGFDSETVSIAPGEDRKTEIVLRPSVPAGQVRGRVLDLGGKPIAARVTITPGNQTLDVEADGSFTLDLAPGRYNLKFQHSDYSTQWRKVRVHDKGVVIVDIALTR